MSDITVTQELDCRGLNCPMPIMKTKKAVDGLSSGDVLKMVATDPGSANDMIAWAKRTGNELVKTEEGNGEFVFFVKKK
ncbi:MAG: sulfurtransferase TusA family protein [Spirochaetia bacterium]|nr:sulfurtransferase TusA family protein [Spirochaetia bacterium]